MSYAESQQLCVLLEGIALRIAGNLLKLPFLVLPAQVNGNAASFAHASYHIGIETDQQQAA